MFDLILASNFIYIFAYVSFVFYILLDGLSLSVYYLCVHVYICICVTFFPRDVRRFIMFFILPVIMETLHHVWTPFLF